MQNLEHQVRMSFSDGEERSFAVRADETVLEAALRESVPLLNQCQSGSCGSCVAQLVAGDAPMRKDVATSLLKSEQAEGQRLTCVCLPDSDCRFVVGYPVTAGEVSPSLLHGFIDAVDWVAHDVVRLRLELAEGEWLNFLPGQFVRVRIPGTDHYRRYSMSSTLSDLPRLELLIRILPDGVMSNYLAHDANIDDVLELEGPYGSFFFRSESPRANHLLVAGGTGLAPMMSILDTIRHLPGKKPNVLLNFGCHDEASLFNLDDLDLRRHWMPSLETRICVSRGGQNNQIINRNPVDAIDENDVTPETVAYVCGPPDMVAATHARLEALGVPRQNVFSEQFVASDEEQ